MAFHTTFLPLLYLLFLIVSTGTAESGGGDWPPSPGAPTIAADCHVTFHPDLCISSIISRPGSSNFTTDDVCKAAVEVTIENATDTRNQISKMLRGSLDPASKRASLDPASKRALRECENQYDLALYNLTSTEQYLNSDAFNKTRDYNPVLYIVQDAFNYANDCASMLSKEKGVGEPLKQRAEMVLKLADNASVLIMFMVV